MTASTTPPTLLARTEDETDQWSAFFDRVLPVAAIAGPLLATLAALFVSADIQTLPGDLDWISEPESFLGYLAAILMTATWITVGRAVARRAPRTGITVTVLGVLGAFGYANGFVWRHFSIDLVDYGVDADDVSEVWENPTLFSALADVVTMPMTLLAPLVAGVAILKTKVAPGWAGAAFILFVPTFVAAQAAYAAIEFTYPASLVLLLTGVTGAVRRQRTVAGS